MWPFKSKEKPKTIIHKDYKKLMHKSITLKDGNQTIDLYEFVNIEDTPSQRYVTLSEFIEDKNRGMSKEELASNLDECLSSINKGEAADFTDTIVLLRWMRQRVEIQNDIDLIMRLVSCAFYLKDEDVTTYDWDVGNYKIELFEKNDLKSFFLSEPIKKYWISTDISKSDMELIIAQREAKILAWKELKEIGISISTM